MFFVVVLQRIFEPPEVKHDRLFLVSVIGFIVNLIGVFAFHGHGHSHGGGGGGHGHSHGGGGHGHSHGKEGKALLKSFKVTPPQGMVCLYA